MRVRSVVEIFSALAFDEIVWAVKRHRSPEDAETAGEAYLKLPGLEVLSVDADLLPSVLDLMRRYRLDPRDAIHAASALRVRAETIVSSDTHFDRLKEIGAVSSPSPLERRIQGSSHNLHIKPHRPVPGVLVVKACGAFKG